MKRNLGYLVVLLFITTSCVDKFEKDLESLSGSWQLSKLTYLDPSGELKVISDSETILVFTNALDPKNFSTMVMVAAKNLCSYVSLEKFLMNNEAYCKRIFQKAR